MEKIEREIRKVKPVETPFIPYKNSLSVMLFSQDINKNKNNTIVLNIFYNNIKPYHNIVRKVLNKYGWNTPSIIYNGINHSNNLNIILQLIKIELDEMNDPDLILFKRELLSVLGYSNFNDLVFTKFWKIIRYHNIKNKEELKKYKDLKNILSSNKYKKVIKYLNE